MNGPDSTSASAIYSALKVTGSLKSHRVIAYRCGHRCLLLDVIRTPRGFILHWPRYKLSPAENDRLSSAAGRASNTEDGGTRWNAQTAFIHQISNPVLQCDHVLEVNLLDGQLSDDLKSGRAEIVYNARGVR